MQKAMVLWCFNKGTARLRCRSAGNEHPTTIVASDADMKKWRCPQADGSVRILLNLDRDTTPLPEAQTLIL